MTSVRAAKSKGSNLEYDVCYSLNKKYPDTYLTKQLGFQQQQDVRNDKSKFVIECKRLKSISWNQCVKFLDKLRSVAPKDYDCYLVFKSNQQPALVMYRFDELPIMIKKFEDVFQIPFLKHESTRVKQQ
jgi:hypothetical protein